MKKTIKKLESIQKSLDVMVDDVGDIVQGLKELESRQGDRPPPKRLPDGTICHHPEDKLERIPAMGIEKVVCKKCGMIYEKKNEELEE